MESDLMVQIHSDRSSETEYVIKDKSNIVIGRFTTAELNNHSRTCDINLKFYREGEYALLVDALFLILKATFKDSSIFKVNIKVNEKVEFNPFIDLGFTLEGILSQNQYLKGEYLDELLFGITRKEYNLMNKYSLVELGGPNITLRNLTPADCEELLQYYKKNKKHLEPFEPAKDSDFYTIESQRRILNKSYREFLNGGTIELGIFKEKKLIGKIKLSRIVYGSFKNGMLGYSIDEEEQGKGYMKESVKLFLEYVFDECELHRVEASALVDNQKSRGVLEGCGFKMLGINEKYLLINGRWRDHVTYYILKEDFEKYD
jgi:ribosomal-protein-alanine N-acetyltransferase